MGTGRTLRRHPAADRLLLRAALHRGQAGVREVRLLRLHLHQQLGRACRAFRRSAAARRNAHHGRRRPRDRGSGRRRDRVVHDRVLPAALPRPAGCDRGPARRGALRRLWPLGVLRPDPEAPPGGAVVLRQVRVPAVRGRPRGGSVLLHRGPGARDHDHPDRERHYARGHLDRPDRPQGSGAGTGRDPLGDDPPGRAPLLARGHHGRRDAGPWTRDGRDDRSHDRDRQRARDRQVAVRPGLHARGGDRQRIRRGGRRSAAPRGSDRGRPRPLRHDLDRERSRPRDHRPRAGARARRGQRGLRSNGMTAMAAISDRRRRQDKVARGLLAVGTLLALIPLVLILYYLIVKGIGAWSWSFFTTDPTGSFSGDPGGIKSAILGTIEIVGLATLLAAPVGVGVAIWLTEYGKSNPVATAVRYFIDVMTGVPSIVFGLFIYITLVLSGIGGTFAGWKGAIALALLALPIVTRSAEVVLVLVPDSLREAGLALGAPRWKVIARVVLPAALPGIVTGVLLAVARAAG